MLNHDPNLVFQITSPNSNCFANPHIKTRPKLKWHLQYNYLWLNDKPGDLRVLGSIPVSLEV